VVVAVVVVVVVWAAAVVASIGRRLVGETYRRDEERRGEREPRSTTARHGGKLVGPRRAPSYLLLYLHLATVRAQAALGAGQRGHSGGAGCVDGRGLVCVCV